MVDFLTRLAEQQFWTMMVICFALIFAGATIAGKLDNRWGYVPMILGAGFIIFALRVHGFF